MIDINAYNDLLIVAAGALTVVQPLTEAIHRIFRSRGVEIPETISLAVGIGVAYFGRVAGIISGEGWISWLTPLLLGLGMGLLAQVWHERGAKPLSGGRL